MIVPVRQPGYILIFTLSMMALLILIVTGLFNRGIMHLYVDRTVVAREKARVLALSGIQLAMSQLQAKVSEKKEGDKKEAPDQHNMQQQQAAALFKAVMPTLNCWQQVVLKEATDGMQGVITFCISCEDGKLNINQLFDFKTKKFIGEGQPTGDMKKLTQLVFARLKKFIGDKDLFGIFEKFLKQRQYKVDDVTELLRIKEFQQAFNTTLFYEPPLENKDVDSKKGRKRPVYLTDIFTTWSLTAQLNAWALSDSIAALLDFARADTQPAKERVKILNEAIKAGVLKNTSLEQVWPKGLQKLYIKEFSAVSKEIKPFLSAHFNPELFSILVRGTVGDISQKLCAIVERQYESKELVTFTIKKIYWI